MSLRPDHKALVFLGAVAVLGAGVRVSRAASRSVSSPATQPALDRQMASADSRGKRGSVRRGAEDARAPRGGRRPAGRPREWSSDSASSPTDSGQGKAVAQEGGGATHRAGLHQWKAGSRRRDRRADRFAAGRTADDRQTHRRGSNAARTVPESATDCGGSAVSGRRWRNTSTRSSRSPASTCKAHRKTARSALGRADRKRGGSMRPAALRTRAPPPAPSRL